MFENFHFHFPLFFQINYIKNDKWKLINLMVQVITFNRIISAIKIVKKGSAFVELIVKVSWKANIMTARQMIMWPKIKLDQIITNSDVRSWASIMSSQTSWPYSAIKSWKGRGLHTDLFWTLFSERYKLNFEVFIKKYFELFYIISLNIWCCEWENN